jgi:glycine betaine catabolism A
MSEFKKATDIGTGGARTLAGNFYTSPEVFTLERERIFTSRWVCVGREQEIAEPGAFMIREVAGESLIVLRDRSGEVRAFFNVCRHRGTRICTEDSGRFSQTIQCPYHAWTYALDGKLVGAPSMDGTPGFDKGEFPLHKVNIANWEGFLFVDLAATPEPFEETFAPILDRFARYRMPTLNAVRRIDYDIVANWKLIFQNYSECYHCPTAHPQLVKISPADSGENDLTSGPFLGGFMTIVGADGMSTNGKACAILVGDLSSEDLRRVYYYSIFPNMLLSLHADYVMVHILHPIAPDRTKIECSWLFHPEAASHPGFDPDAGVSFWDVTNRQDWRLCELSQLGVASRVYTPGPYSPRESISAAFDREYLRAMEDEGAADARR